MRVGKETLRGHLETIILTLVKSEPMYGYRICRSVESAGLGLSFKEGSLYPALRRLEENALVESYWEEEEVLGRPRRKYYRITPRGAAALEKKIAEWEALNRAMSTLLGLQPDPVRIIP